MSNDISLTYRLTGGDLTGVQRRYGSCLVAGEQRQYPDDGRDLRMVLPWTICMSAGAAVKKQKREPRAQSDSGIAVSGGGDAYGGEPTKAYVQLPSGLQMNDQCGVFPVA